MIKAGEGQELCKYISKVSPWPVNRFTPHDARLAQEGLGTAVNSG
jgi:hypothetical protein